MSLGQVHHLNCGTMCPLAAPLIGSPGHLWNRGQMVCHCLLVESEEGLILIESGFGSADLAANSRLPRHFRFINAPDSDSKTALQAVEALGFAASDVKHVFLTHLDLDHAGGIDAFPDALVHVYEREFDIAMSPPRHQKTRYLPSQWAHGPRWNKVPDAQGESWYGFDSVRPVPGLGDELAMVPLIGHSAGSCAIAVRGEKGWLLHCGDAFFHRRELEAGGRAPLGLRLFQRMADHDRHDRLRNIQRLRELKAAHGTEIQIICSHDPAQLAALQEGAQ